MTQEPAGDQLILATGGYDHTIKLWQAHTGNCIRTMQHEESVCNDFTSVQSHFQSLINYHSLICPLFHSKSIAWTVPLTN